MDITTSRWQSVAFQSLSENHSALQIITTPIEEVHQYSKPVPASCGGEAQWSVTPGGPSASRVTRHNNPGIPQMESTISKIGSSLSEAAETIKKKRSKTNVEESQTVGPVSGVFHTEDEVKATLLPLAIVSPSCLLSNDP